MQSTLMLLTGHKVKFAETLFSAQYLKHERAIRLLSSILKQHLLYEALSTCR
jgi:hypothetical protein